jgi:hypothetical protein
MEEQFINIICSRKNGASKKEIFQTAKLFGFEIKPWMWNRIHYAISRGGSIPIYCDKKRWYSFESSYYKSLVKFVNNNEKGVTAMGMSMGVVPTWIDNKHDIFNSIFKHEDF